MKNLEFLPNTASEISPIQILVGNIPKQTQLLVNG